MEYKELNNISMPERCTYDTLYALQELRNEPVERPASDSALEGILDGAVNRPMQMVECATKGALWWKKDIYQISDNGRETLDQITNKVHMVTRALRGVKQEEADAVISAKGMTPQDYTVKRLLLDGTFGGEAYGFFAKTEKLGDYVAEKLKAKAERFGSGARSRLRSGSSTQTSSDDGSNLLLWAVLLSDHNDYSPSFHDPSPSVPTESFVGGGGSFGGAGASASWEPSSESSHSDHSSFSSHDSGSSYDSGSSSSYDSGSSSSDSGSSCDGGSSGGD